MDHDLVFIRRNLGLPSTKNIRPGLCNYPSQVINIDSQGRIFVCLCEAWLPWSLGHVLDFESIHDIWKHPLKKSIEDSQRQGEYAYCDTKHCGVEHSSRRLSSMQIYIGIDDSCQLCCPSCRQQPVFEKDFDIKLLWTQRIVQWIKNLKNTAPVDILIGSHGDPFASRLYREFIAELVELDVPVRFQLRTNGLLLCRYLDELKILPRLSQLEISIDAATEQTYEQVRRPGRWSALIENLDYCLQVRPNSKPFRVIANFVIQQANYQEMSAFVDLCQKYHMSPNFSVLQDWSTFSYKDNAVHLPEHPCYQEFVQLVNDPKVKQIIGKKLDHWITK
jgi:MoaA/NifB/PqqE/SkfB family radical SAM enzyme